jgi:ankyrin repeat protein
LYIKLLKCGANPNCLTSWNATPLHYAAGNGFLEIVQLLLSHHALILFSTIFGRTPCHIAAASGHLKVIFILLIYLLACNIMRLNCKA